VVAYSDTTATRGYGVFARARNSAVYGKSDYLKGIYDLQSQRGKVSTSLLSERLRVSSASVTEMIQRLAEEHMVNYTPYKGVALTEEGQRQADGQFFPGHQLCDQRPRGLELPRTQSGDPHTRRAAAVRHRPAHPREAVPAATVRRRCFAAGPGGGPPLDVASVAEPSTTN